MSGPLKVGSPGESGASWHNRRWARGKSALGTVEERRGPMNYATIKFCDIANGIGVRTTLFVSGCRVHCPGCFNKEAWDFAAGEPFDEAVAERLWKSLEPAWIDGLTLLGGEPFEPENQQVLRPFLEETRYRYGNKNIWCFTGYRLERDLLPAEGRKHTNDTIPMLACIDVLVDGPFMAAQHDISLRFRGSANQRLIDMGQTRLLWEAARERGEDPAAIEPMLWHDERVYETRTMELGKGV